MRRYVLTSYYYPAIYVCLEHSLDQIHFSLEHNTQQVDLSGHRYSGKELKRKKERKKYHPADST